MGRIRGWIAGLVSATALAVASGAGAATITQPASGQTVSLTPSFSWTMAPNEVLPQLTIVRTPSYNDPNPRASCQPDSETGTSCGVVPLDAGTYYAFVQTDDNNTGDAIFSPLVRFTVPVKIGFARTDPWGGNPSPIVQTERAAGVVGTFTGGVVAVSPFSSIQVEGWLNDPGAKVTITYTVTNGSKIVRRVTHTQHAGGEEDWSFGGTGEETFVMLHVPGVRSGAKLKCKLVLKGDGVSTSKTVAIRNPPAGGHFVHKH